MTAITLHPGGVLLANPIPEAHALDRQAIEAAIQAALADADTKHVRGKALTPHLLSFLATATAKKSLAANRALAIHNAEVAAEVAAALSAIDRA